MVTSQTVHLAVEVDGEREGAAYKEAVADLQAELEKYLPPEALPTPSDGDDDKGSIASALNIDLGVGDALTELVRCLRDWLARNDEVVVKVRCGHDEDGNQTIEVRAKGATEETIKAAIATCGGKPA